MSDESQEGTGAQVVSHRPAESQGAKAARRRAGPLVPRLILIGGITLVVLLATGAILLVLYARGGGPLPDQLALLRASSGGWLDPSPPAEVVLRTLRLAGFPNATVGESGGTVVVRVAAAEVGSSADIETAWQTGMAAASVAYPKAERIVVQICSERQALIQVSAKGADVAAAVMADDAVSLRRTAEFRYLPREGSE